jgi:hypothetical protein
VLFDWMLTLADYPLPATMLQQQQPQQQPPQQQQQPQQPPQQRAWQRAAPTIGT